MQNLAHITLTDAATVLSIFLAGTAAGAACVLLFVRRRSVRR